MVIVLLVVIFLLVGIIVKEDNKITQNEFRSQQNMQLYELMYKWYGNEKKGVKIENYFIDNGIEDIAIYGKGKLGEIFYDEIKDLKQIKSLYWIDKFLTTNLDETTKIINIVDTKEYKNVDVIIVTPVQFYDEIEQELRKYGVKTEIVSLEDIIYSI